MGDITRDPGHNDLDALTEPMAIIGLATRFPQDATDTDALWKLLVEGRNAHTPFPEDRIGPGHYHPDPEHGGTHAVQGGHFLSEDPAYFDAPFFSITKGEAVSLDPQQRLVLENVYLALENSGLSLEKAAGTNTSVYVSGFNHDHLAILNTDPETTLRYRVTGLTNSMHSNRVSWFFDLKGPSATIDTACSSSMAALHFGCQSLRTGESNMAVVTGVTVINYPGDITGMSHQGFLGQHGKCFSFDAGAEGYARGEGVGTVIVKRLRDAVRDGDTIRAVIRGTGINQDGRTPGLTLPDSGAQERLIKKVYASAGLDFDQTMMVEAHGTGTGAGDPIESNGIARAFASRRKDIPLYVGSIKASVGHLEGAAGVAGVIKAILTLENGVIPPQVNFNKPNPKIKAKAWNLAFPTQPTPWPSNGLRRISINSFGVGGTNAHAVLDDAYNYLREHKLIAPHHTAIQVPTQEQIDSLFRKEQPLVKDISDSSNGHESITNGRLDSIGKAWNVFGSLATPPQIVLLSSFDEDGVKRIAKTQGEFLAHAPPNADPQFVKDVALTLSKRSRLGWRSHTLARTTAELTENLQHSLSKPIRARGSVNIGYVFTGQSAQWYGMGRELLCYPIFRDALLDASTYFQSLGAEWSLLDELAKSREDSNVDHAWLAQPACTALQIAIVDLLSSWRVLPSRVVGHSSGEICAAYVAGKLDRKSALKAAYFRGVVSSKTTRQKGAMLAVGLGNEALQPYLQDLASKQKGALVVACLNSPKNCTVSGDESKIDLLRDVLDAEGIFARKLNVKNAYHSSHMEELSAEYLELLGTLSAPDSSPFGKVQMFSTVSGELIEEDVLGPEYWVRNLISPVRFLDGLAATCFSRTQKGQASLRTEANASNVFADILLEIGPHGALQSAIKDIVAKQAEGSAITSLPVLNRSRPGAETVLNAIGYLACRGYAVDVQSVNQSWDVSQGAKAPQLLVELPGYAFNHSQRFWYESRLSKNYRLRKEPRHDLFGAPVADWDVECPRWRNIIRLSEQPWLRDHIVTNSHVYPGVGYLIAAIHGARQIADPELTVTGFRLRDISLKRAMIIPDSKEGLEVMLTMTRMDESSLTSSTIWRRFEVKSYNPLGDDWLEHCTGYIATDYDVATGPVDNGREAEQAAAAWRQKLREVESRTTDPWDIGRAYENMATVGLKFGPLFRNGSAAKCSPENEGIILGTVTVPDVAQAMPKGHISPHLIHPAAMDSMIHFALGAIMNLSGSLNLQAPMVPTFIKDVFVSANLQSQPGYKYKVNGRANFVAYEKYATDVLVWDEAGEGCISMTGIQATPLDSAAGQDSQSGRELCHVSKLTPYLEMITQDDLTVQNRVPTSSELTEGWLAKLQLATLLLVTDALDELEHKAPENADGHLIRYFEWMQQLDRWVKEDKVSGMSRADFQKYKEDPIAKTRLYKEIEEYKADGRLAVRMGSNIVQVLRKEVDPLHLMFGQDDILDHVYAELVALGDLPERQAKYLGILADNCTNLRVLEVGAGTGSSTRPVLESLAPLSDAGWLARSSVSQYTYTDISTAFFEAAREKFKPWQDIIDYKVLDAGKDIHSQGFELGSYDLIIAQNVIHATPDLQVTLSNLRGLLKPGGRFLLQEGIRQDYFYASVAFGQLSGWWLGVEPTRKWSPFVSAAEWDVVFKASGFSGVDLEMQSSLSPTLHTQSLLVATAAEAAGERSVSWRDVVLVTTSLPASDLVRDVRAQLENKLDVRSVKIVGVSQLKDLDLSHSLCISLAELERPVLATLTQDEFVGVQSMLTVCKGLLWVTGDMVLQPHNGLALGLVRTVRWERDLDDVNLATLAVSDADSKRETKLLGESITNLARDQFYGILPRQKYHGEYTLEGGRFLTSRLQPATAADEFLTSKFSKAKPVLMPLKDAGRPIKLSSAAPGRLDRLEWVTDNEYDKPLEPTHVEIEVKAAGLNFRDLMIAMGQHLAYSIGCEASGVISRVGSQAKDFKVGDRVCYITGLDQVGCFHTFGRLDQATVTKIPDDLSFEDAAGLPAVWVTVLYGLREVGKLAKGERVLIHAAAGGVGQAAIHYAKHVGAEIFATVSTPEKRDLLVRELGIPEDHIFSSRDLTFAKGVMRATGGKGVDVVLNSLAGEALRRSWDLLAPFGRFVEIGKKDADANSRVDMRPLLRAVTMTCVDLVTMMKSRPHFIKQLTDDTIRLWSEGVVKPASPTTVRPMSQLVEGFQILQSGKGTGKMIFVPHAEDIMPIVPAQALPYRFKSDATYVLAGGLGGLGRSIAKFMVNSGARTLAFLSSSGAITDAVVQMQSALEAEGCQVHIFKADVSDPVRLKAVIEEIQKSLPPIKGVIQGAMKLNDSIFENQTYDQFQTALKPKVDGSWNLHSLLPRDLDYFVMLSSATGILGNRGQANYAAGNTFQDMLAYHRRSQGLVASTIDVGSVLSVGYVAENAERVAINKGRNLELELIREDEIHAMLEYVMDVDCNPPAQLVTGLTTMEKHRQRGVPAPTYMGYPFFTHLNSLSATRGSSEEGGGGIAVEVLLNAAKTLDEAAAIILTACTAKLASLLSVAAEDINSERSVSANGVDSLVAMEFRAFLAKEVKADVPVLDIMGTLSLSAFCRKISTFSKAVEIVEEQEPAGGTS